jgi:hypothetical protein
MNEGRIPMGGQYLVRNSRKSPMKIRMWIVSRGRGRMLDSVYFCPILRKYAENGTRKWMPYKRRCLKGVLPVSYSEYIQYQEHLRKNSLFHILRFCYHI